MSSRNIRKLMGGNVLPPPDDDSDGYEPLCVTKKSSSNIYEGLISSSQSESEEQDIKDEEEENTDDCPTEVEKKKKKKKRKQRKPRRKSDKDPSDDITLDEIDRSLKEVNDLLGVPEPVVVVDVPESNLMSVQNRHLNYNNEIFRIFGPDEEEDVRRRRGRTPNLSRLKRGVIVQNQILENFTKFGLTMTIESVRNGITYFVFNHSERYQKRHRAFVEVVVRTKNMGFPFEDVPEGIHPEEVMEVADMMFRMEDYSGARKLIERAISYMQYVSHPLFYLSDSKVRLEYVYVENRMFHVAVLKYLHMLTNTMCHRTALELAKLLLNLDPSDPLGVLFIIDTLALRAREHQWLIDIVDFWKTERQAHLLINMQYSYAMAHFHVARKNKRDISHANELLQTAMLSFPTAVVCLLHHTYTKEPEITSHPLFSTIAQQSTSQNLHNLVLIYTKFTAPKWREPEVLKWFVSNAKELVNKYDTDLSVQERAAEAALQRKSIFVIWPDELIRHMVIIKPMANLLLERDIPNVGIHGITINPVPVPLGNGINRYGYKHKAPSPECQTRTDNLLTGFILSMAPAFFSLQAPEIDPNDMAAQAEARNSKIIQRRDTDGHYPGAWTESR
ncbi:transcription factor 25 [Galleria mellonella]|uniref:Transcription factor 25 n=1 Tax=Galleria mellonella TaxID=7137 RepID=A0A6J1X6H4_GALME|nr:transcription factor 25 [Galleria mellonella]XP_026761855.1 transcription factor 25 [Galleria mellonella]